MKAIIKAGKCTFYGEITSTENWQGGIEIKNCRRFARNIGMYAAMNAAAKDLKSLMSDNPRLTINDYLLTREISQVTVEDVEAIIPCTEAAAESLDRQKAWESSVKVRESCPSKISRFEGEKVVAVFGLLIAVGELATEPECKGWNVRKSRIINTDFTTEDCFMATAYSLTTVGFSAKEAKTMLQAEIVKSMYGEEFYRLNLPDIICGSPVLDGEQFVSQIRALHTGEKVIVRSGNERVLYGMLEDIPGPHNAVLENCRSLWAWGISDNIARLASKGVMPRLCASLPVEKVVLADVSAILPCSERAVENIEAILD